MATYAERLALYEAAEAAILGGSQSYSMGSRSLTRGDLGVIQRTIRELKVLADRESRGGIRVRGVTPVTE